jgi:hypothetical protein
MKHWYVISADKNSQGNALQMSNFFYETKRFAAAEPNWYHLSSE